MLRLRARNGPVFPTPPFDALPMRSSLEAIAREAWTGRRQSHFAPP